ncbi:MAG: CocE/NonD family hydrolase, partial [Bacteroidota bacterium]
MTKISALIALLFITTSSIAQGTRQLFEFPFEGVTINGVLNLPETQNSKGIVLLVYGSGTTNAVAQEWYQDIRATFVKAGYGIYMWDKMGCGDSGGTFDINQTVDNSALEVIAAINTLKEQNIPGTERIGLYGGSRASWINLIVINQYKDIAFWISVSGVDNKENFGYLLEQNLRIEGVPQDSIDILVNEWKEGNRIQYTGGTYEEAVNATQNLSKNAFLKRFNGGQTITKEAYYNYQDNHKGVKIDEITGLPIVVNNFETILSNIRIPVLALFGERDMNVDWKKTKSFYKNTLAKNTDLEIKTF